MAEPHALQRAAHVEGFVHGLLTERDAHGPNVLMLDCDGVVWEGDNLEPSTREALAILREHFRLVFCTNNAVYSRRQYLDKFHRLGLDFVTVDQIFSSGSATAAYLKKHVLPDLPAHANELFVIGQPGFEDELREAGLTFSGGSDPAASELMPLQDFSRVKPNPRIGAVAHAFDMHVSLYKYAQAYTHLAKNPGCKLILTNADTTIFAGEAIAPGEGAWASLLRGASPEAARPTIVGKPEKILLDMIRAAVPFEPSKATFIGDRLETDVLFGRRNGTRTLLVLTGSSKVGDLARTVEGDLPDAVCDSLFAFASVVQRLAGRSSGSSGV